MYRGSSRTSPDGTKNIAEDHGSEHHKTGPIRVVSLRVAVTKDILKFLRAQDSDCGAG